MFADATCPCRALPLPRSLPRQKSPQEGDFDGTQIGVCCHLSPPVANRPNRFSTLREQGTIRCGVKRIDQLKITNTYSRFAL
eukprot:9498638-Pyramimonas_sp.AAC.1